MAPAWRPSRTPCALPGLEAEGIFTHFAVSDEDDPGSEAYTREQFNVFTRVLEALAARGRTFAIRHCANSGALARYPEMYLDMVRPGIALYGAGADAQRPGAGAGDDIEVQHLHHQDL